VNRKIKELSEQAISYAAEQYGPQRRGEQVWNPATYDQKFAELIIDECCFKLLMMDAKAQGTHNYYKHAALELKRNFTEQA
jgi:hypothetical protein